MKSCCSRARSATTSACCTKSKASPPPSKAIQNIRVKYDPVWANQRVELWLKTYFDYDYVFIFDGSDKPIFSQFGRQALDASWFDTALVDLESALAYMRGRNPTLHGTFRLTEPSVAEDAPHMQAAVIRSLAGRPAVIAAVAVGPVGGLLCAGDNAAPIMMCEIHRQRRTRRHRRTTAADAPAQARRRADAVHRFDL